MSLPLAPLSAVLFSQFVAADAGSLEAKHDARLCALFGAFYSALLGNKTQLSLVAEACAMYATPKACRVLTATPDRASAAATRAAATYNAYAAGIKAALPDGELPGLHPAIKALAAEHKGRTPKTLPDDVQTTVNDRAAHLSGVVACAVRDALAPVVKAVKTEEEKTAAKEAKVAAEKLALEQQAAKVAELAAAEAGAANARVAELERQQGITVTLADMARIVANAIKTGQLAADDVAEIEDAMIVAETAALLALPVVEEIEVDHVAL